MTIARTTPMKFGKHKGTPISELPLDYLEWAVGDSGFDREKSGKWVDAFEREIKRRSGNGDEPDPEGLGGKAILDNLICAFAYIEQSLNRLGFDTSSPDALLAIQKLATSASIAATDRGLDLRAAVGREIATRGKSGAKKGNPEPLAPEPPWDEEDASDLPF